MKMVVTDGASAALSIITITITITITRSLLGNKMCVSQGTPRALPPWEVTWGGGASVENPHYQRVHYCELILREFLGVVERGRTDIWKDVQVVLRYVFYERCLWRPFAGLVTGLVTEPAQRAKIAGNSLR